MPPSLAGTGVRAEYRGSVSGVEGSGMRGGGSLPPSASWKERVRCGRNRKGPVKSCRPTRAWPAKRSGKPPGRNKTEQVSRLNARRRTRSGICGRIRCGIRKVNAPARFAEEQKKCRQKEWVAYSELHHPTSFRGTICRGIQLL